MVARSKINTKEEEIRFDNSLKPKAKFVFKDQASTNRTQVETTARNNNSTPAIHIVPKIINQDLQFDLKAPKVRE